MSDDHRVLANPFMPPPSEVRRWFEDALGRDDPRPSSQTYDKLAREIQIIANRHNNSLIERERLSEGAEEIPLLPTGMADVSPVEWEQKKLENVATNAGRVLASLEELRRSMNRVEEYAGDYRWNDALSITEFNTAILDFLPWLFGVGGSAAVWRQQQKPQRGRPKSTWHEMGRKIGCVIQESLREVGYNKRLSLKNEDSVVVVISTSVVNWVFDIRIQPGGFATAMRSRKRGEAPS